MAQPAAAEVALAARRRPHYGLLMEQRIDLGKTSPQPYQAMLALEKAIAASGLEPGLLELVKVRASQLNHCAYCIDMHWKDARARDESEQRLYGLSAWRESPYYTERERAALAWTEAVTFVAEDHVPDALYDEVRRVLTDKELADLTLAVATINAWNRLSIAARLVPGGYQPAPRPA